MTRKGQVGTSGGLAARAVRLLGGYALAQLALGLQAGTGAAALVVAFGWTLPEALPTACVAVLPVGLAQLAALRRLGLVGG